MKIDSLPSRDGFMMPAEFEPHEATIMVFPERPGSWPHGAKPAQKVFTSIIKKIAECEKVYVAVSDNTRSAAEEAFAGIDNVVLLNIPTDDAWARDIGPTFVKHPDGRVRGISWRFNAWGGEYDGLYAHWEKDDAFAAAFCDKTGYDYYDAGDFVLEGGSIHSDGAGTLMVTESCLLSKGRNPELSKAEIEDRLKNIWGRSVFFGCPGVFTMTKPTSTWTMYVLLSVRTKWYSPGPTTKTTLSMKCRCHALKCLRQQA